MSNPILYRLLDLVEGSFARLMRKPVPEPALQQIVVGAFNLNEMKTGRHDVPERIPSRFLVVPEADQSLARRMGAQLEGEQWVVPEGENLEDFEIWWPKIVEDLHDKTQRGMMTKEGQAIEGYQLPGDVILGTDSTATPLMYGALPVISALAYVLAVAGSFKLAVAALAMSLPFLVTIKQGEGVLDSIKAAALLLIGPLLLSFGALVGIEDAAAVAQEAMGSSGAPKSMIGGMGVGVIAVLAMIGTVVFSMFDKKYALMQLGGNKSYAWDAFFERLKGNVKWTVLAVVVIALCFWLLPDAMKPYAFFALASLYPMIHTETNYNARTKEMEELGMFFNLARKGKTAQVHVEPRLKQAIRAHEDKSALISLGTAEGWLTMKQYPFSPDPGMKMKFSALDIMSHLFIVGMPGQGKTETLRSIAKQWVETKSGGFLCLCGKGSLPSELSQLIDLMIRPGISYAHFQGLDAQGVANVMNSLMEFGGGKSDIWDKGARGYIDHLAYLHQALRDHELAYKSYATHVVRIKEEEIDYLTLEISRLEKQGLNTSEVRMKLEVAMGHRESWSLKRDGERVWLWNVDTHARLATQTNQFVSANGVLNPSKDIQEAMIYLGYDADAKRKTKHPESIHPEIGVGSLLDGTIEFFLKTWPATDERQRSSFMINVTNMCLLPLTRGKRLVNADGVHWKMLEKGVDVTSCLYGKGVGLDLPVTIHGEASLAIAAFVQQLVYTEVEKRSAMSEEQWRELGQLPLIGMYDEAHLLVGKKEAKLASISRSLRMGFVCATQQIESLIERYGDMNNAYLLANTFQSLICFKSSAATYEYMAGRLGKASIVKFQEQSWGIDFGGALRKFAMSPLNDPNHPYAAGMQKMKELGAGRPVVKVPSYRGSNGFGRWQGQGVRNLSEDDLTMDMVVNIGGHREDGPLLDEVEYTSQLSGPGRAIVYLNRAGYVRVDVAKMDRVGPNELRASDPVAP